MKTPIFRVRIEPNGFTLVELAAVVVIIGLVAAVTVVRLDVVLPGQRLRAAATALVGAAELARSEARLKQGTVSLEYELDNHRWALIAPGPHEEDEDERDEKARSKLEEVFSGELPKNVEIAHVYYSDTGQASFGVIAADFRASGAVGEHMVVLKDASGATRSVFVPALSGAAFVTEKGVSYAQVRARRRKR